MYLVKTQASSSKQPANTQDPSRAAQLALLVLAKWNEEAQKLLDASDGSEHPALGALEQANRGVVAALTDAVIALERSGHVKSS